MADKKRQGISSRPHHCTPSKMNVGSTCSFRPMLQRLDADAGSEHRKSDEES